MSTLSVLLVEDNFSASLEVEMFLAEIGHHLLAKIDNGADAIEFIIAELPDVVIMDIDLIGPISGVDVAKQVKHLKIPIIYTTSVREKAVFDSAMETGNFGYLVKPYDKLTLQSSLELAAKLIPVDSLAIGDMATGLVTMADSVLVKKNSKLYKIRFDDIVFVQSEGNYCTLHTADRKFVLKTSLKKMLEELPTYQFYPVHKRYVVNLDKLDSIDLNDNLVVIGNKELTLGPSFRNPLLQRFRKLQ